MPRQFYNRTVKQQQGDVVDWDTALCWVTYLAGYVLFGGLLPPDLYGSLQCLLDLALIVGVTRVEHQPVGTILEPCY